ncbi:dihydrodipicolinate synthase family protein [Kibdelosporangium phytohabitans]|uniref:Dihydrodipicolinate synthase n=1 Tax=Kibdelosporangium phytohabitans TaxID=860235 RepID=A0A0N9HZZ7_9PSEU|nr:dihydrodipicolinate synthase family protein [Kibdelosporangium phytohabitans]ALG08982.1 dihydrodipicolinate synthase [Kibdelosporangium phytohabitans]MBE1469844.1 4-hydroxy-tetrahydrodipicolinate synthase [Kibdelosporangium phytohabitans]
MDALRSVVLINATPFDATGAVATKDYAHVLDRAMAAGIEAVTPNGNTGEFYSLTPDELDTALAVTVETAKGRATVVAGVGHELGRATKMATAARDAGAEAVMVHQPVHPYLSEEGWVAYHRAIANAVPSLGVVCYLRSPHISPRAVRRLAVECPNVVAVKYAVPDAIAFAEMVSQTASEGAERLVWLCGLAESWAPFLWIAGAEGFTTGLGSVAPELSLRLFNELEAGNPKSAMRLWRKLKPFEDLRARHGNAYNVSAVKEALAQLEMCRRDVRPPISELPEAERAEVGKTLREWGIKD